jgi:glutathione S-transferase
MKISRPVSVAGSFLASQLRGWRGTASLRPASKQPGKPIELYEFEACPYGRLVREALTELDLDAMIYPCPRGGRRFRPKVKKRGGKEQFPYLVDPNTGVEMYESADIIEYLRKTYAGRGTPKRTLRRLLAIRTGELAALARGLRGSKARPSRAPAKPLELFSFESSPFSRLVRERLCELEIPYLLRNTGKGRWTDWGPPLLRDRVYKAPKDTGRNRKLLAERTGRVQLPYLVDPNTGEEMYESAAIIAYLEDTYAT